MVIGEPYDLLLKGGRVIDPRSGLDGLRDVAIQGGRIAAIEPRIDPTTVKQVRPVGGKIVCPGLIDFHTHVYDKATSCSVDPAYLSRRSVVSTLVDAGSAGAGNFAGLRDYVMTPAPLRILAFLNISFPGIFAFDRSVMFGEARIPELLVPALCAEVIAANRDRLVGVKVRMGEATSGDVGMKALDLAIEAAEQAGVPLMTHIGAPPPTYDEILARLRPGDILTHCFRPAPNAPVAESGGVLDALIAARERGVLFDIGHGAGAFHFRSAEQAISNGFPPDIISSDAHTLSIDGPAYDLLHTMSKLANCGIPLPEVIGMATDAPARAMRRADLGHLAVGAVADISVIAEVERDYSFRDVRGEVRRGSMLLEPDILIVGGTTVEPEARPFEMTGKES